MPDLKDTATIARQLESRKRYYRAIWMVCTAIGLLTTLVVLMVAV